MQLPAGQSAGELVCDERPGALFRERKRGGFARARDENARHVLVVPILDGHDAPHRPAAAGKPEFVMLLEIEISEILDKAQSATVREHRQQIEFAGEIEIGQQAVPRSSRFFKSGEGVTSRDLAIGGESEGVRNLLAQHDHVLEAIVVQSPTRQRR